MKVHVLASGSTGNATFIEMGGTKLLVDAGISARRIKNSLAAINIAIGDIDGILVTHEHRDHINGLPTLIKQYKLPIYTRPATFQAMYCREKLDDGCCIPIQEHVLIGNLKINTFNISHDAADPVGFNIYGKGMKCTFATDLGFVTSSVQSAIDHSDVLILEANHDVGMLKNGSYPRHLKQRILSNRGHLSNEDAAWALVRMKKQKHTKVLLAHLSEENNRPDIAEQTVNLIMERQGYDLASELEIQMTKPDEVVSLSM